MSSFLVTMLIWAHFLSFFTFLYYPIKIWEGLLSQQCSELSQETQDQGCFYSGLLFHFDFSLSHQGFVDFPVFKKDNATVGKWYHILDDNSIYSVCSLQRPV